MFLCIVNPIVSVRVLKVLKGIFIRGTMGMMYPLPPIPPIVFASGDLEP